MCGRRLAKAQSSSLLMTDEYQVQMREGQKSTEELLDQRCRLQTLYSINISTATCWHVLPVCPFTNSVP